MEIPPEPTVETERKKENFLLIQWKAIKWQKVSNLMNRSVGLEKISQKWFTFKSYINICFIRLIEYKMKDKNIG